MRVLKFSASWCAPCRMLAESMKEWNLNGVHVEEIDIDHNRDSAIEYGVRGVPTVIVLDDNNNVLRRRSGLMSEAQFKELVNGTFLTE